jgi:hypothetical protein
LIVEGAYCFCSRLILYRSTTVRLKARRGSEEYHSTNSLMAWSYVRWPLLDVRVLRTADLACSKSGRASTRLFGRFLFVSRFRPWRRPAQPSTVIECRPCGVSWGIVSTVAGVYVSVNLLHGNASCQATPSQRTSGCSSFVLMKEVRKVAPDSPSGVVSKLCGRHWQVSHSQ